MSLHRESFNKNNPLNDLFILSLTREFPRCTRAKAKNNAGVNGVAQIDEVIELFMNDS